MERNTLQLSCAMHFVENFLLYPMHMAALILDILLLLQIFLKKIKKAYVACVAQFFLQNLKNSSHGTKHAAALLRNAFCREFSSLSNAYGSVDFGHTPVAPDFFKKDKKSICCMCSTIFFAKFKKFFTRNETRCSS